MSSTPFTIMVRKALIDKNMKQKELAEELNVSQDYLNHILTGRKSPGKYEQPIRSVLGLNEKSIGNASSF